MIDVKYHGVTGDGSTDDAPAIQALIDGLDSGVISFPPGDYRIGSPLVLRDGVFLTGRRPGFGYMATSRPRWTTRFRTIGDLPAVVTSDPEKRLGNAGVQGIDFEGSGTASRGIDWADAGWCVIRDVHMNNFLDQFVNIGDGAANVVDNFLGVNGLRRHGRTERVGSIELGGFDHMLTRIETGGGYTPGAMTDDGLNTAFYIKGGSIFGSHLVAEFSETGYYFDKYATGNRFGLARADKGGGNGFVVAGDDNTFTGCHSANMAREAHDTYTGFRTAYGATGNSFNGCRVHNVSAYTTNLPRYAFEDLHLGGAASDRNTWSGCTGDYATAMFFTNDWEGSAPVIPPHPKRHPANSAVLDVTNSGAALLNSYSMPTTITGMTGGVNGQTVRLLATNGNVSVAHNGHVNRRGSICTRTGTELRLAPNVMHAFTMTQGVWYQDA